MKRLINLLPLFFLFSCSGGEDKVVRYSDFALDTTIRITLYGRHDTEIFDQIMEEIRRLEGQLSYHKEGSEIAELSESAGDGWLELSPNTEELLRTAQDYGELSGGLLDITAAPLIDLWAIDPPHGHVPSAEELEEVFPLINYRNIEWDGNKVRLPLEGMGVNLGALAKGYIADEIKSLMEKKGIHRGIINLGGNILLIGEKPGGNPYRIGVQDPLSPRGEDLGVLEVRDNSLVSSGDYERYFFDEEGNKYHHILDPFTGYPSDRNLQQVTILSPTSLQGDALSTSLFLMGLKEGYSLVLTLPEVEAVFVTKDMEVFATPGLVDNFTFRGEASGYTLKEMEN